MSYLRQAAQAALSALYTARSALGHPDNIAIMDSAAKGLEAALAAEPAGELVACDHHWEVTSQRALGMWCKCAKCGATKEETWD